MVKDVLKAIAREGDRTMLIAALEEEVEVYLGRRRYQRCTPATYEAAEPTRHAAGEPARHNASGSATPQPSEARPNPARRATGSAAREPGRASTNAAASPACRAGRHAANEPAGRRDCRFRSYPNGYSRRRLRLGCGTIEPKRRSAGV